MTIRIAGLVLLVFCVLQFTGLISAQEKSFDDSVLSADGRKAYQSLLKEKLFAIGGIGYGGTTSPGEKALDVLVEEKDSSDAFRSLIRSGSVEGGLYGLFGLRMIECDCFAKELATYRAMHFASDNTETLSTQSGCLLETATSGADKNLVLDMYLNEVFEFFAAEKECRRLTNGRAPDIFKACLEKRKAI